MKNHASFPQEITRTSQTYRRQSQSAYRTCCAFLSRRARLPWHTQKMCAVTIVGTVLTLCIFNNKIKYVSITVITLKQQACIMFRTHLIHVFFFWPVWKRSAFQNFVSERIKLVYRINNTRLAFLTSITTIYRPQTKLLNKGMAAPASSISSQKQQISIFFRNWSAIWTWTCLKIFLSLKLISKETLFAPKVDSCMVNADWLITWQSSRR